MISGFLAQMAVDDAGTGAAFGGASTLFAGLTTFNLPSLEAGKFEATELDQGAADPYERELPTGLVKIGPTSAEMKYNKSNYQRLQALVLKGRGYTFVLTTPDDQTTPGTPVKLVMTGKGFISKVGDVKFEKGSPVSIPFEITFQTKPTSYA